jgi:enoyl-CoA hydratase
VSDPATVQDSAPHNGVSQGAAPQVLFERVGVLGRITLNRPKAMNALTFEMVTSIASTLREWETDPEIETVAIVGAGDRGLCAGGDIVSLFHDIQGTGEGAAHFWADEYALNLAIANYPKPYVAIMDGVVLGGGVGVSAHGSVRVVTERTRIGMPEVGIGFVPDVGGTYLLSRAPGELGTHAGLTGGQFSGADAIELGLADHFIESERLDEFLDVLTSMSVHDALLRFASDAPPSALAAARGWIDECYSSDEAIDILARLSASENEDARATADVIRSKSPTAVAVTLESLRRARAAGSLAEVLDTEFRVSVHFAAGTEMAEGIRAQVIDKDRNPHWNPATLAQVTKADVDRYFTPTPRGEPGLSMRMAAGRHERNRT